MRKNIIPLICLLSFLILASNCKKDKSDSKYENFELNGTSFETLQEAFNSIGDGQTAEITLLQDAEGDGGVLPEGKNAIVFLDFGEFCYNLNEGTCINLSNNEAILSANGGAVKGEGFIIKSKGQSLSFDGDITIEGGIETASETDFYDSFIGSVKGDLTIDGCEVYFMSPEATANIHQLVVKGEDASMQIVEAPKGGMKIDKVISTLPHPVCSMESNAATIGDGGQLHVHNFTIQSEEDATCCTLKKTIYTCSECGMSYEDFDVEGGYGLCNPEDLVHYDAVPQGDTTFGHAEYWQCPHCGDVYSDANGSDDISGDYLFLPNNFEAGYPFIDDFGDFRTENFTGVEIFGIISGVIDIVSFISTIGMAIPGLIDDSYKWTDLQAKIDAVSGQLSVIDSKVDALIQMVKALPAKRTIMDRQSVFHYFTMYTMPTISSIDEILKSSSYSQEVKTEMIRQQVKTWAENMYGGTMLYDLALTHMMQFYSTGIGSVPHMYEDFANTSFLWEHDGYAMRQCALLRDVVLSGCSFVLAYIYNSDIRDVSTIPGLNREKYLEGMKTVLENYSATVKKDMYRMSVRKDKLIKINMGGSNGTCFDKKMRFTNVYGHLDACWDDKSKCRLPRENQDDAAVRTCENIVKDCGGFPFTRLMAEAVVTQYNSNHPNAHITNMWNYLVNSIGFNPNNLDSLYRIIVREDDASTYSFGHDNNDVALPHYGPFYWRSYRLAWATDWFGVRSVLGKDGNGTERLYVLPDCSIQSYSSGHFKKLGNNSGNFFCSPASLTNEPADTVIQIKPVVFK